MIACLAVTAQAVPTEDIIAETSFIEDARPAAPPAGVVPEHDSVSLHNPQAEALELINVIQSKGGGDKQCLDAATQIEKDVWREVKFADQDLKSKNNAIAACKPPGTTAIKKAEVAVTQAKKKYEDAKTALTNIGKAKVVSLDDINRCIKLPSSKFKACLLNNKASKYSEAVTKHKEAKKKQYLARGEHQQAVKDFETTKKTQNALIKKCQCKQLDEFNKAWADSKQKAAGRKKAWTKARHVVCAIKALKKCSVTPVPQATKPTLSVKNLDCKTNGKSKCMSSCPDGWTGDGNTCIAPTSYNGHCKNNYGPNGRTVAHLKGWNPTRRVTWAGATLASNGCQVTWTACGWGGTCMSSCPDGWSGDGSTCTAPASYNGRCKNKNGPTVARFKGWNPTQRVGWAGATGASNSCQVKWTACGWRGTCLSSCPDGWSGDGKICTAPASYGGPCANAKGPNGRTVAHFNPAQWSPARRVGWGRGDSCQATFSACKGH